MRVQFDHIEVHVDDISRYGNFLKQIFEGGECEVISLTGTSMFTSPEGICIEIKKRTVNQSSISSGFCNPCLRRPEARGFLSKLGLPIERVRETPAGEVYFFRDHENNLWHIKSW